MPPGEPASPTGPTRQNLLRLWLIRSILIAALLIAVGWLREFTEIELPWAPLLTVLLTAGLVNAVLLYRLWLEWPVGEGEFFTNLLFDMVLLTAVLYLTGGSSNPLVSYYLIPLIISAALLRPRFTWAIAALAVGAYTMLFFYYVPFEPFAMGGHRGMMSAHLVGMWINFAFSALLISWFVVRMARSMREQELAITRIRERGMRDEQIISAASIAAGTAHELRTPLATMTVLAGEMRNENPQLEEDLGLLQEQLDRCDEILRELVSTSGEGADIQSDTLEGLVEQLLDRWRIARPEIPLEVEISPEAELIIVKFDQSLVHALLNFLHNAADASPEHVSLQAGGEAGRALIVIQDRGVGIPDDIADALGNRFVSRKDGGLGLGVLLSHASIERHDGQVTLHDRKFGGTRLEIRL
jgi:two-component system sensor histidine kinase RegB